MACGVPEGEHRPWIDAWRRVRKQGIPDSAARATGPVVVPTEATVIRTRPIVAPVATLGSGPRFSVLGPVRAWLGEEALPAGSPQQRALLAALL
ncbi:AfsR/SARP family transcriptional regulator, partial [Streptomyces sp. NPDC060235]